MWLISSARGSSGAEQTFTLPFIKITLSTFLPCFTNINRSLALFSAYQWGNNGTEIKWQFQGEPDSYSKPTGARARLGAETSAALLGH